MRCASKYRKEMKLKMSCVLDSSPICLTKVRIKMLMIMYYRCILAANRNSPILSSQNVFEVLVFFLFHYMYHKSTSLTLINIRNNKLNAILNAAKHV